jgi:head-tail adaptor
MISSDFRYPITIQERAISLNSVGQEVEDWDTTTYSEMASIERAYKGGEEFRESSDIRTALAYFWMKIRFRDDIAFSPSLHRISYSGRTYNIWNVTDLTGKMEELWFLCEEAQT